MMKKHDAVFGAENSSHFFYRDFYHADSGMITLAIMLKLLSEGLDFDEKLDYIYTNYPMAGEVNYIVNDTKETITKVEDYFKQKYPDVEADYIDGITMEFDNWRFNLRSSNTQAMIRLNVEGKNREVVIEKFREVEGIIDAKRYNEPIMEELK
jgi:phosphomannomutase